VQNEVRKLVVFVPREALDTVRDALFEAGAGRIGNYERCSWYTQGTGTFLAGEGSSPALGEVGREQRIAELRLETVFPADRQEEVVAALRSSHPYEEPAFDVYVLL
jgi:hypothetical protein